MAKKTKKPSGFGGLYVMIAICVACSCLAVFGLMGKLETYQESEDTYADLQQAALTIVSEEEAAQEAASPMRTISPQELLAAKESGEMQYSSGDSDEPVPSFSPTGEVAERESQGPEEEENVLDEALVWMLKNQTEDELITDRPRATATPAPSQTPAPAATEVVAEATAEPLQEPTEAPQPDTGLQTLAPMLTEAPAAASEPVVTPQATPAATAGDGTVVTIEPANTDAAVSTPAPTPEPTNTPEPTPTPTMTPVPTPTVPPYIPTSGISMERAVTITSARYSVDFDYLTTINDEVVGWIYQEGTPINYPVLRGEDNEYYLTHLFNGVVNSSGSVFMDSGNSAAFIDSATYLYGHHSKGGGMFATLSEYLDPAYYEAHPQFLLVTPFMDYQVDVFAGMATLVEDEVSWRPKTLETEADMNEFLELILSQSFIQAPEDKLPQWGDKLLVLVTCTNIRSDQRYVIYGRMRPIVYQSDEESVNASKQEMDQRPTENGYVTIDGVGTFMTYAQNDELWRKMRYEAGGVNKYRNFGDGGCGPTAVAMAIANLCPVEELPRLIGYANTEVGYTFCDCSVNRYFCNHKHAQYQLRRGEEFLRYMPLAVANFATGNNIWEIKSRSANSGTNMRFLEKICAIYGIRVSVIEDVDELIRRMEEEKVDGIKRMAISCAIKGSPFTKNGHFVLICGLDDEYLYFLDPLRRDDYSDCDRKGYAEVLAPGVVRISRENAHDCNLIPFYLLEKVQ